MPTPTYEPVDGDINKLATMNLAEVKAAAALAFAGFKDEMIQLLYELAIIGRVQRNHQLALQALTLICQVHGWTQLGALSKPHKKP